MGNNLLGLFSRLCIEKRIKHRLTKAYHPWMNGQVERMNRTIKSATIYRYFYSSLSQLNEHLNIWLNAYNFAQRLKTLMEKPLMNLLKTAGQRSLKDLKLNHYIIT